MIRRGSSSSASSGRARRLLPGSAFRYAALGALFGAGSPLGFLFLRFADSFHPEITEWLRLEMARSGGIYLYMAFGTVIAFAALGFLVGHWYDSLASRAERFEIDSMRDPLTGLYVRRYLLARLEEELKRAARYDYPVACLFIDVDDFKRLNDAHGHIFGDEALTAVSRSMAAHVRDADLAGRYGGDEFLVVLPGATLQEACHVAERVRRGVEALRLTSSRGDARVTVSVGVSMAGPGASSMAELVRSADAALLRSKARGKNVTATAAGERLIEGSI